MILKKYVKRLLIFLGPIVLISVLVVIIGGAIDSIGGGNCGTGLDNSTYSATANNSGGNDSWKTKGSPRYRTAQTIFSHLTKDVGLSGAAASGIMGNIAHESGFNTAAVNSSDGGKGLIQWTFGREAQLRALANKEGKSWSDLGVQLKMLDIDLNNQALWVSAAYPGQTLSTFAQLSDPGAAALHFYISGMEAGGGNKSDPDGTGPKRVANAQEIYKLFNGASIKADKSKFSGKSGSSSNGDVANSDNSLDCDSDGSAEGGDWGWPFKSIKGSPQISGAQLFGNVGGGRVNGFHDGVDFGTVPYNNQSILAVHGGKVIRIAHQGYTQNDLGWYVVVKGEDYTTIYQEFAFSESDRSAISVKVGDTVKTGDKIGKLSSSYGNVTHVHIGATKKNIDTALAHSFNNDGTWTDWTKLVGKKS